MGEDAGLVTLPQSGQFPKVKLIQPTGHGYVIAAFEIDHRPPIGFAFESRAKREAIAALKRLAADLRTAERIEVAGGAVELFVDFLFRQCAGADRPVLAGQALSVELRNVVAR